MHHLMEALPLPSKRKQMYNPTIIPIKWESPTEFSENLFEQVIPASNVFALRKSVHFKLLDVMYYMSHTFQNKVYPWIFS